MNRLKSFNQSQTESFPLNLVYVHQLIVREHFKLRFLIHKVQPVTMFAFPRGRSCLVIVFFVLFCPDHCDRSDDVMPTVHHWPDRGLGVTSLLLLPSHVQVPSVLLVSAERGAGHGTAQIFVSHHGGGHSSSNSSDRYHGRQGASRNQVTAKIDTQGADVNINKRSVSSVGYSVSVSRPRNGLNSKHRVSKVLLRLLNDLRNHGGLDYTEVPHVLATSLSGQREASPSCFMLCAIMKLSAAALLPSTYRPPPPETEIADVNLTRQSPPLFIVDTILIQHNCTSNSCSCNPNSGVIRLPRKLDRTSLGHNTLPMINLESAEPVHETPKISPKQANRQFHWYPFWPKLFSSQENDQSRVLTNVTTYFLHPVIREILILLMALMTVVFRCLPQAFGANKTKNDKNAVYLKVLTKSFFMKWAWVSEGRQKSFDAGPVDRDTDKKNHQSPGWKRPELDILNSFIFRPWLTKATSRQCQPYPSGCISSASSLCSSCQHHLNNFMANTQCTLQVYPAFLPDPTGNPSHDLAHMGYRLATLAAIPSSFPVSRIKLANAGFYSRGQDDEVMCYSCGVSHSGWRVEENPMDVHRQLSPACQHVLQVDREVSGLGRQSGSISQNTLSPNTSVSGSDGVHEGDPSQSQPHPPEEDSESSSRPSASASATTTASTANSAGSETRLSSASNTATENRTSEALSSPNSTRMTAVPPSGEAAAAAMARAVSRPSLFPRAMLDLGGAVYPAYNSVASRRRTFTRWDDSRAPPLNEILLSGMFYAGYADCVRCFYCGVGLKHWVATDNVWDEHVRWRPECGYLRAVKGERFIRETQRRLGIDPNRASTHEQNGHLPPPPPPPPGNGGNGSQPSSGSGHRRQQQQQQQQQHVSSSQHPPSSSSSPNTTSRNGAAPSNTRQANSATTITTSGLAASSAGTAGQAPAAAATACGSASVTADRQDTRGNSSNGSQGTVGSNAAEEHESLAQLQEENAELSRQLQCRVCQRVPVETVLLPCSHLVVCENCAGSVTSCPLCHEAIRAKLNIAEESSPP